MKRSVVPWRARTVVQQHRALQACCPQLRGIFVRLSPVTLQLTAVFEKVPEGYIAFVEELPGANTQGATLEEARANLDEAVRLVLEANRTLAQEALGTRSVIRERFKITPA